MLRYLFCLAVLVSGCKGAAGPSGPTGSTGSPGDAIPTLQMLFKSGELPSVSYAGVTMMNIDYAAPSSPITDVGIVRMAQTPVAYGGQPRRILIRFDITQYVPKNSSITNVVLQLTSTSATNVTGASVTIGAYDLSNSTLVDSGSCVWTDLVRWFYYNGSNFWTDCGGTNSAIGDGFSKGTQFPATPMDQVAIPTTANGQNYLWAWSVTPSTVQKWLDTPAKNNGILIASTNEYTEIASGSVVFGNLAGIQAYRPTLIVNYYIP